MGLKKPVQRPSESDTSSSEEHTGSEVEEEGIDDLQEGSSYDDDDDDEGASDNASENMNEVDSEDGSENNFGSDDDNSDVDEAEVGEEVPQNENVTETGLKRRKLDHNESTAVSRSTKRSKLDLPTKDEQLQLHNTEALMRTNLLRLQVDEMLKEVNADEVFEKKKLRSWLDECLGVLRTGGQLKVGTELSTAWVTKQGVDGLSLEGSGTANVRSLFAIPTSVSIVGSSTLHTATAPFLNVDIGVVMPDSLFEGKDLLNHGYFNKRKLYIAALHHILSKTIEGQVSLSLFKGDHRKPVLVVRPPLKSGVVVRVLPILSASVFKLVQLKMSKNNVRPLSWAEKSEKEKTSASAAEQLRPTPHYNQAVLEDIAAQTQAQFLTQTLLACPVAREVIVLLKIWLTQRALRFGVDGLDGHSATLFVAYLVQTKRLSKQMPALAAFTLVLKTLADNDLSACQFDFTNSAVSNASNGSAMTLWYPVFDAHSGTDSAKQFEFNTMWRVSASCISDLQSEARRSLQLLQAGRSDTAFHSIFMHKSSQYDRHDLFFHIPVSEGCVAAALRKNHDGGAPDHEDLAAERRAEADHAAADMLDWDYVMQRALALATEALGDRVSTVRAWTSPKVGVSGNGVFFPQCGSETRVWTVTVGVVLNKDRCQRRVDKGPSAEDAAQVEQFRKFWGPKKSQIRRFQDGSIIEAVLWEERLQGPGYVPRGERIVEEILRHIWARHLPLCCGAAAECVVSKVSQLEHRALPAVRIAGASANTEDADALSRRALESVDKLRTVLISLLKDQLPLPISSVTGTSAELRYTALYPPQSNPMLQENFVQRYAGQQVSLLVQPLALCAVVEGGGKWPKEAQAVLKLKLAYLLRLSELLASKMKIVTVPRDDALDIIHQGFVFRLRLVSDLEVEKRLLPASVRETDPNMMYPRPVVERNIVYPLYCNAVKALHAQFPSFAGSVRLLESWVHGHYFSGLVPHEALELIAASIYLNPEAGTAPTSPSAGFSQALGKLAGFDWESTPLVIDLGVGTAMSSTDRVHAQSKFTAARQERYSPLLYIVSSVDAHTGFQPLSAFDGLDRTAIKMVIAKAKETFEVYSRWVEGANGNNEEATLDLIMKSTTAIDRCNAILQFTEVLVNSKAIKSEVANDWFKNMQRGAAFARLKVFSNLSKKETSLENLVIKEGSTPHPVQEALVVSLREAFGDIALFFWNAQRATEVGVLWKPAAFMSNKFSILESRNKLALLSEDTTATSITVLNITEITAQMLRIGDGLFKQIRFV